MTIFAYIQFKFRNAHYLQLMCDDRFNAHAIIYWMCVMNVTFYFIFFFYFFSLLFVLFDCWLVLKYIDVDIVIARSLHIIVDSLSLSLYLFLLQKKFVASVHTQANGETPYHDYN